MVQINTGTGVPAFINLRPAQEVTISAGVITVTQTHTKIETEGAAATDDLDTINGGTDGDIIILRATNAAHTVVVKDGTGNIFTAGDFSLTAQSDTIMLLCAGAGGNWFELSRSDNSA